MKPNIRTAALTLLPLTAILTAAFAADNADLTIKGSIRPSACSISLSDDALISFGTIFPSSLSQTSATRLASKPFTLSIQCDAPTKLALSLIDGRKGTANNGAGNAIYPSDSVWYGVGNVDGKNIGAYTIQRNDSTPANADGEVATRLYTTDGGDTWGRAQQVDWTEPGTRGHGWSVRDASAPGAFKTITQQWQLDFAIGKATDLPPLTSDIQLDGLVTFQIKYL
ncbi:MULTISPECIES: DUF1120 domain-containing protein [Cupriavidus]|uniref:DUF1120 domain-containing protein n=1 Tax=Cupriavidus pauculus TaxID=82633 RepID=A0A5P2H3W2_9BURK|nr:DUF1120 domain-containing protein [Cupriavidus pauculus]QET02364.1 DUF1120 domain-containing protein [Cupriavidus pauculus]